MTPCFKLDNMHVGDEVGTPKGEGILEYYGNVTSTVLMYKKHKEVKCQVCQAWGKNCKCENMTGQFPTFHIK
jgi:hypothetical protein